MKTSPFPLLLLLICHLSFSTCIGKQQQPPKRIVVFGSLNIDTFLPVDRLPMGGENLMVTGVPRHDVPGGKGATQAVAAHKLLCTDDGDSVVAFVGQWGMDVPSSVVAALNGVDTSFCRGDCPAGTGRGYVFLTKSGEVSAVVSGGANIEGWGDSSDIERLLDGVFADVTATTTTTCCCCLLQCEIPERVNLQVAKYCRRRGIRVLQDVGGEDRRMSCELMALCDYLIPNESELRRLVAAAAAIDGDNDQVINEQASIVELARRLQQLGARNVLVTQGSKGCTLVSETGPVLHQPASLVESVVDETGAGDCFRAAFAVALSEGKPLDQCLAFAAAAGACAVTRHGAIPSTPDRKVVESVQRSLFVRGGGGEDHTMDEFPFLIGSRLNSMKDRPELWDGPLVTPKDFVQRQASIKGLTCVDFNYPQHFHLWSVEEAKEALDSAGLVAGAVCLRFPNDFARGAMNHPDSEMRARSVQLTKEAAGVAKALGCQEVVVWSAFDGYDYPFQVNYDAKWQELVHGFRECCDAFPDIKFSIEYKPTDEHTRFFTVPSTGAALLLAMEVDRPNFGLTLDVGHMLMTGENPGQSIAMATRARKLFGIQLNDGFTRLAAEDGLMFGSVHPSMALEIMYQLRRGKFDGHVYFDTFPQRSDPVQEAEYNIERVKAFWRATAAMEDRAFAITKSHDAIGALRLVDEALRRL
jgi:ribokinase